MSNTIAALTGATYRAAFACKAVKDVRFYLNGIHLDTTANKVVSTNGHIMYVNDIGPCDNPGDPVTFIPVKLNASADTIEVCRHDDHNVILHVTDRQGNVAMHVCPTEAARYPDYNAVVPTGDAVAEPEVIFDVKYLAILKQVFKRGARFEFTPPRYGDGPGSARITGQDNEGTVVLMPCRGV